MNEKNKESGRWVEIAVILLLVSMIVGIAVWAGYVNISRNEELAKIKMWDIAKAPYKMTVTMVNAAPMTNYQGKTFGFGDKCVFEFGTDIVVVGPAGGGKLLLRVNPDVHRLAEECPIATLFFEDASWFRESHYRYQEALAAQEIVIKSNEAKRALIEQLLQAEALAKQAKER